MSDKAKLWLKAAGVRAVKTIAQTAVATIGTSAMLGDVIQLRFQGEVFQHSPVVVQTSLDGSPDKILLAAHSTDADWRPLSSYEYEAYRILHILGVYDE